MYRALYLALLCSSDSHPDIALYYVSMLYELADVVVLLGDKDKIRCGIFIVR